MCGLLVYVSICLLLGLPLVSACLLDNLSLCLFFCLSCCFIESLSSVLKHDLHVAEYIKLWQNRLRTWSNFKLCLSFSLSTRGADERVCKIRILALIKRNCEEFKRRCWSAWKSWCEWKFKYIIFLLQLFIHFSTFVLSFAHFLVVKVLDRLDVLILCSSVFISITLHIYTFCSLYFPFCCFSFHVHFHLYPLSLYRFLICFLT